MVMTTTLPNFDPGCTLTWAGAVENPDPGPVDTVKCLQTLRQTPSLAQIRAPGTPRPQPITPKFRGFFMTQVKSGDTVRIHYTGTLTDGTTFDSSQGRDPLEFTVGQGQIIPGLEKAIPGMTAGDKKTVAVPAAEAYGPTNPEARQDVPRDEIPAEIPLDLGTQLQVQAPDGQVLPVTVVAVTEEIVTLDANHPLAGKDLTFDIELVEIA